MSGMRKTIYKPMSTQGTPKYICTQQETEEEKETNEMGNRENQKKEMNTNLPKETPKSKSMPICDEETKEKKIIKTGIVEMKKKIDSEQEGNNTKKPTHKKRGQRSQQ